MRAHLVVVAGACSLLVLATMAASAALLRDRQDRTIEAIALEVANGVEVEGQEDLGSTVDGAAEYFRESRLEGYRFELVDSSGTIIASDGRIAGWDPDLYEMEIDARAAAPRRKAGAPASGHFRACARWCGPGYVVRVVTDDVLVRPDVRRFGTVLLAALPVATVAGAFLGRALFRRKLAPLGQLEEAAAASSADPGVALKVETASRELATLRDAFNGLLARLGEALSRERRFTQEASHELRTPLAVLRGRVEGLEAEGPLTPAQREHAGAALAKVDALDRLVDALLLLARSESASLPSAPVNLCDLARDVARQQAVRDGAGCRPPVVEAPDEILVRGSEQLLERAIANLVENARKFGGPRAAIRIRVSKQEPSATVAVADDGPGIDAGEKNKVFDRFFRGTGARRADDGVGLGLAVTRAIVHRHRGEIEAAESDLGGAEFRMTIPLLVPTGGDAG